MIDLDAAREFADEVAESEAEAADMIRGLADEVRKLRDEDVRGRMEEMQRENARLIAELVDLRARVEDGDDALVKLGRMSAELDRLRERRRSAAEFVRALDRRGKSIGKTAAEVLLNYLVDDPAVKS